MQKRVLVVGATPEEVFQKNTVRNLLKVFNIDTENVHFTGFAVDPKNGEEIITIDRFTSIGNTIEDAVAYFEKKGCNFEGSPT